VSGLRDKAAAALSIARAHLELRGTKHGARVRCYGGILVRGRAGIQIGSRTTFLGGIFRTELRCEDGAELVIGPSSTFNYGVSIVARRSIRIGARCNFGSLVHIRDDDGRRIAPVSLADGVWLAHGAVIEPGSTIGEGSVVGAGSVVSGMVPPHALAVGNPATWVPLEAAEPPPKSTSHLGSQSAAPPPSRDEVRAAIIEWLDDTRHFGEAANLILNDFVSLRRSGALDSLGLVQLVLMLEDRFGVSIDRDLLTRPEAQSMNALLDRVTGTNPFRS
jgi:acetyltransferase-like isoleucine patch superfamily enzyme/acyl carrier protein